MKFNYNWSLSDLQKVDKTGLSAFSFFSGGGGSSMGYKMSGVDVLGCCEIDEQMISHYIKNLGPKLPFPVSIQNFKKRKDLPKELFELDILDGSPPCSTFSPVANTNGGGQSNWGKKKKFREGQSEQILDDLFFEFIDVVALLKPKVVVAENVEYLLRGKARGYTKRILQEFCKAGYKTQLFLLNGTSMGFPQNRSRAFFICQREDLEFPKLQLGFNESLVTVYDATGLGEYFVSGAETGFFKNGKKKRKSTKLYPSPTITSAGIYRVFQNGSIKPFTNDQLRPLASFPRDYKFKTKTWGTYIMGMSVPPLMTHKITEEIKRQWLLA